MDKIKLKKGTLLYRCSYELLLEPVLCYDTGKRGIYFSTYILQALATCIEYNESLHLGIYELIDDIEFNIGKYTNINDDYYYLFGYNTGIKKCNITYDELININHFDNTSQPYIDKHFNKLFDKKLLNLNEDDGEVFIGNINDLNKLKLKEVYYIEKKDLIDRIKCANYATKDIGYLEYFRKLEIL